MTTFWREGFWRYDSNGEPYWVRGHLVERNDWERSGQSSDLSDNFAFAFQRLSDLRADKSATARFVNPNAVCPVCGDDVFFYQNVYGSKVFFDELGPPWPKHPCTSNLTITSQLNSDGGYLDSTPIPRDDNQRALIDIFLNDTGTNPEYKFWTRCQSNEWKAWRIDARFRTRQEHILVLSSLNQSAERRIYPTSKRFHETIRPGGVVFTQKNWLSYFNLAEMNPTTIQVKCIRSAKAVFEKLVSAQSVNK